MGPRHLVLVLLGLVIAAIPVPASTTGQLSGRVLDQADSPLPGVAISASSPAQIGGEQLTQTDLQGVFLYPRLAPGVYSLRIALDGFVTQEINEVRVGLGRVTEIRVTLPQAQFGEQVTVTEQTPVVDPTQVSMGQTFTDEYLQNAAIGGGVRWAFTEILTQTAGTRSDLYMFSAPTVSVFGSTSGENVYLIDGLDTTNSYWGTGQTLIPLDSIQEINFQTAGFEAQYGRATGGMVNTVTKSGSNQLKGTVDVRYSDNNLEGSGDHYDPEEQPASSWVAGATLGGKFIRDRAWYFSSMEALSWNFTPTGSLTTFDGEVQRGFVKVTGQASANWLGVGKYHKNPISWTNLYPDPFVTPEANAKWDYDETILQAEVSGVLSPSLLIEFQAGSQRQEEDYLPVNDDRTAIGHWNLDSGMFTVSEWVTFQRDPGRDQLGTTVAWLLEDLQGTHDLRAGIDYQRLLLDLEGCWTGNPEGENCRVGLEGFLFSDVTDAEGNSIPYQMTVRPTPPPFKGEGSAPAIFVQDSWRPLRDLSLNLGLRWDQASWDNDIGREVANLEMIQPRVGATWGVTRDGRSFLRATWGRFMHPGYVRLPRFAQSSGETFEYWGSCSLVRAWDQESCFDRARAWGFDPGGFRSDPAEWDPIGWFLAAAVGTAPTVIQPGLDPMYADELILGFERQLIPRTSLELSFVDKKTRDIFDNTCIGNYPVPTEGADCSSWIIANIPEAQRDYRAWILRFESRALDRVYALASYTYSDSKGSIQWSSMDQTDFNEYPFHFDNRYGYLQSHQRHRIKFSGFAVLPWKLNLSFNGLWASPWTWTPIDDTVQGMLTGFYMVEPRGSREGSSQQRLDLQLAKAFDVGRLRLQLIGTVINVLDNENAVRVCDDVDGCGEFGFEEAIDWQSPRYFELGVRLEF